MNSFRIAVCLLFALAAGAPAMASTGEAWGMLAGLAGTWKRVDAHTPAQQAFRISYRLISADTALVETFGNPAGKLTQTVYHRDGDTLLATHYCAQGNQPRLRASRHAAGTPLLFEFVDVTNLARPGAPHMVRLSLEQAGRNRLVRKETYLADGKEEESILVLERVE